MYCEVDSLKPSLSESSLQMEMPLKILILIPSSVYLPKLSNCQYNFRGRVKVIITFVFKRSSFLQLEVPLASV